MIPSLQLRLMSCADIGFADSLRNLAGWNQTAADWERFIGHEPDGCFIAEWNGTPAGTATTTSYGTELAWIGMVLVHPESRRHGIGKALLNHGIDYLRARQIRCIKLDATPAGKKLYDTLGFRDEWTLTRWETPALGPQSPPVLESAQTWKNVDPLLVEQIDARAFGTSRQKMLALTASQSTHACLHVSGAQGVTGYGFVRPGTRANYLGPVVATSDSAGVSLIRTLLAKVPGQPTYWDIPDQNLAAVQLAKTLGFVPQRQLIRMYLGDNCKPGVPAHVFAIAAPEIG